MIPLDELYAACAIEYSRTQGGGVLAVTLVDFIKGFRDSFNLPHDEALIRSAIGILEELGAVKVHKHSGVQSYLKVDFKAFEYSMKIEALDLRKYQMWGKRDLDSREYDFLEAFADLGRSFLGESLVSVDDRLNEIGTDYSADAAETAAIRVQSSDWTGRGARALEGESLVSLVRCLDKAEEDLEKIGVTQEIRTQARAYIVAMRALAEAPDPQTDMIWEMLNRANQLSGVASLFVSILALFVTVAH